jgi:alpha-glucosidase/alpha-D-xyloside xylohydrolase
MAESTRRGFLTGLAFGATHLLFSRTILPTEVFGAAEGVPAVGNAHLLTLVAVNENTLRLRVVQSGKQGPAAEIGIVPRKWSEPLEESAPGLIPWGNYTIHVEQSPWRVTVADKTGKTRQQVRLEPSTGDVHFSLGQGPLFGLGEGSHPFNHRGSADAMRNGQIRPDLETYGARVPIPWLMGAGYWGIFFAHPWGSFDLGGEEGRFHPADATPTRDIFIVLADSPADLLRNWAELTGYPHMPPLWALGFQQSHRTLGSREDVLEEATQFRKRKLPCDTMIYLGTGFCPSGWNTGHGSFTFNPSVFPDPSAMIHEMHDEHFKVVLHMTSPPEDLHGEVGDAGAALDDPSDAAVYWTKHLPVQRAGVDGWWPDEGDELPPASRLARNRMYWEGSQQLEPDKRPFALHRNGYAGLQRYAWLWSGDTYSTWKALAAQVMVGINAGLCGIPYWGTDTGGFVPTKEFTAELFVRWFQFSAFCPSFRCHGRTWKLHLPWGWNLGDYGPAELDSQYAAVLPRPEDLHNAAVELICRKYLNLRYSLLPYTYSAVAQTHATGLPLMRSLWLAYPDDARAAECEDVYLWGESILVAPVLEPGATQRATYLPYGAWWDYWSGERMEGGRAVTREVDLETLPLYVKAGSILPIGPVKQHTQEASTEPLKLRVYPGADGACALYEDDGSSFRYEQGEFTRIACTWTDEKRELTLMADPKGRLPQGRLFHVEMVGRAESRQITLSGDAVSVRF